MDHWRPFCGSLKSRPGPDPQESQEHPRTDQVSGQGFLNFGGQVKVSGEGVPKTWIWDLRPDRSMFGLVLFLFQVLIHGGRTGEGWFTGWGRNHHDWWWWEWGLTNGCPRSLITREKRGRDHVSESIDGSYSDRQTPDVSVTSFLKISVYYIFKDFSLLQRINRKLGGEEGRCRCYERRRAKGWGNWSVCTRRSSSTLFHNVLRSGTEKAMDSAVRHTRSSRMVRHPITGLTLLMSGADLLDPRLWYYGMVWYVRLLSCRLACRPAAPLQHVVTWCHDSP